MGATDQTGPTPASTSADQLPDGFGEPMPAPAPTDPEPTPEATTGAAVPEQLESGGDELATSPLAPDDRTAPLEPDSSGALEPDRGEASTEAAPEEPSNDEASTDSDPEDVDEDADEGEDEESEEDRWAAFAPMPERTPGRIRRMLAAVGRTLIHEWTLVSVGSVLLAVLMTWPALRYPQYTLPQDTGDPTLVAWLLAWPGHILLEDPTQLWHGNAFFPERWSYAYTDSLLGYAPAGLIGDGPAAALLRYNILYVLVYALAFVGGYALVRQLGTTPIPATVLGLAFAYAPWRLTQAGHLHVLSTGGIALALAMLARGNGWSLRDGFRPDKVRPAWILAGWLVAAWQITLGFGIGLVFGYILAGICLVAAVGWGVRRILRRPRQRIGRLLTANLFGGLLFAAVTILMALPYLTVVEQHPHARREFELLSHYSPPLQGFITAPEQSWLWGALHAGPREALPWAPEMALLPGFTLIGLAAAGLFFSVWSWRARLLLAAGVAGTVVLGMGTTFQDGMIYQLLHTHLPGWDALRTPGRLVIWTTLLLGILAAGTVAALLSRARELSQARGFPHPGPWLRAAALVPVALVLVEGVNTTPHPVVPQPPAALATVDGPVLVLPSDQLTDMQVMLWTTDRFIPVVNGGSGFTPHSLQQTREITTSFPDEASVAHLRALGVETVLVLPEAIGTPWEGALTATGDRLGITREEIDQTVVFHLNREPSNELSPGPGNDLGGGPGTRLEPDPRPSAGPGVPPGFNPGSPPTTGPGLNPGSRPTSRSGLPNQ